MAPSSPAFNLSVVTPLRSASGWNRGLPPPAHGAPAPIRRTPSRATLSEPKPTPTAHASAAAPPPPVPAPPAPVQGVVLEDTSTVDALLNESNVPDSPVVAAAKLSADCNPTTPIDALVAAVVTESDPGDAMRPRADVVRDAHAQTAAVHAGQRVPHIRSLKSVMDAIQTPLVQSATFTFRSTKECIEYNLGRYHSFEYARYGNPTTRAVEEKLMALDGAEDCLLSASGMNAVTTMLLALVPANGHVVTTTDCYRRTRQFVETLLPKMGIRCTVLDPADVVGLEQAFRDGDGASLYFSESPTNPMIRVVDAPKIVALCRRYDVISCLDTTFATPFNFRAVDFGADLVLHSGTKYLSGHQDVMCGALAGRADLIDKVRKLHGVLGGVVDPHAAYLILRGMKTVGLRIEAHNRNAEAVANYLSTHDKVARVHYPTLKSHPDFEVGQRLFKKGFGGVLSFELKGDGDAWSAATFQAGGRFVDNLKIPYIGPSLGGCESLVEQVCIMGYFNQELHIRKKLGINNGLIRFACGIEDADDLIADIDAALRYV